MKTVKVRIPTGKTLVSGRLTITPNDVMESRTVWIAKEGGRL